MNFDIRVLFFGQCVWAYGLGACVQHTKMLTIIFEVVDLEI